MNMFHTNVNLPSSRPSLCYIYTYFLDHPPTRDYWLKLITLAYDRPGIESIDECPLLYLRLARFRRQACEPRPLDTSSNFGPPISSCAVHGASCSALLTSMSSYCTWASKVLTIIPPNIVDWPGHTMTSLPDVLPLVSGLVLLIGFSIYRSRQRSSAHVADAKPPTSRSTTQDREHGSVLAETCCAPLC